MRDFTYTRERVGGFPPIHALPCPLHPDNAGMKSAPKRCSECMRIQRRARHAAIGEPIGSLYASARHQATLRGLEFTLTIHQFKALREQPCVYAYTAIIGPIRAMVGIDRRDSSAGYTPENSQPCCGRHNLLKSDMLTHEQTLDAVSRYQIPCGNTGAGRKRHSVIPV
jgi:hypothetical protein